VIALELGTLAMKVLLLIGEGSKTARGINKCIVDEWKICILLKRFVWEVSERAELGNKNKMIERKETAKIMLVC
jgi:hypothetical protein